MCTATPLTLAYTGKPIRAVLMDGRPWFALPDICRAFSIYMKHGIPQATQPGRLIAAEEQRYARMPSVTGPREVRLASPAGLFEIVRPVTRRGRALANAPTEAAAKRFRQWIETEAVPALERAAA